MPKLSDSEIVCSFMERPDDGRAGDYRWWWQHKCLGLLNDECNFFPVDLTLDRLHEVEARLTEAQWRHYISWWTFPPPLWQARAWIHASAEQKITALAAVLRPEVEGR